MKKYKEIAFAGANPTPEQAVEHYSIGNQYARFHSRSGVTPFDSAAFLAAVQAAWGKSGDREADGTPKDVTSVTISQLAFVYFKVKSLATCLLSLSAMLTHIYFSGCRSRTC